jgi:Tfp pilus assembly protein PilN
MSRHLPINLASQPFRRERAQNVLWALACVVLFCSLLVLVGLILHVRGQARHIRNTISAQRIELQQLEREQARYTAVLRKPGNEDVFSTSTFLNQLIARRGVSWTKVFEDLATVMPANVRLLGVRLPQVAAEQRGEINRVELDMQVGTEAPEAVIDLLKRLQQSTLFGAASEVNQAPPTQNDPLYKFRVVVAYGQKL